MPRLGGVFFVGEKVEDDFAFAGGGVAAKGSAIGLADSGGVVG